MQQCLYNFVSSVVSIVSRFPKPKEREIIAEIGFDEFNNGHDLELPWIGVAYTLLPGEQITPHFGKAYCKKGGFSGKKRTRERFLQWANKYAHSNGRFLYDVVERSEDPVSFYHQRCLSIARLVYESHMNLMLKDMDSVAIVDGRPFELSIRSREGFSEARSTIENYLQEYGLQRDMFFRPHADSGGRFKAVEAADQLAYIIGAKKFGGDQWKPWPWQGKKIDRSMSPLSGEYETEIVERIEKGQNPRL